VSTWRPVASHSGGYESLLSSALEIVDKQDESCLWPVDVGTQLIVSDYSGQHREATHEVYSFLITTLTALEPWLPIRDQFRARWLPDGRRLSFKQLREPVRRRAYPHFLELAGNLPANLITIMVDNRVGSFVQGGPLALAEALDDCFTSEMSAGSVEKIFRLSLFIALLQAGLRKEDQPSLWISDHDETLDSFDRRERFGRLATYLTFGLTGWKNAADQHFTTTESENLPLWAEDVGALPDIAAGACAQLSRILPLFMGEETWTVPIIDNPPVDWRARIFGDWLSSPHGVLRHVLLRLAPNDNGEIKASAQRFLRRPLDRCPRICS
jgi:hypothetical protein